MPRVRRVFFGSSHGSLFVRLKIFSGSHPLLTPGPFPWPVMVRSFLRLLVPASRSEAKSVPSFLVWGSPSSKVGARVLPGRPLLPARCRSPSFDFRFPWFSLPPRFLLYASILHFASLSGRGHVIAFDVTPSGTQRRPLTKFNLFPYDRPDWSSLHTSHSCNGFFIRLSYFFFALPLTNSLLFF